MTFVCFSCPVGAENQERGWEAAEHEERAHMMGMLSCWGAGEGKGGDEG